MDRGFYLIAQKSVHQLEAGDWIVSDGEYVQVMGVNGREVVTTGKPRIWRAGKWKYNVYAPVGR